MSWVALAAVAASGAVLAQNVELYGRVDLNVTQLNKGKKLDITDGSANGAGGSRIGFRGTEDLGGGLKAGFLVETAFTADANTGATTLGSRNSYLDLSGGFGTVRVGRHLNPALTQVGAFSAFGTDYGLAAGSKILETEGARYNNAISFMSPSFSGLSLMATVAMKQADSFAAMGPLTGTVIRDIVDNLGDEGDEEKLEKAVKSVTGDGNTANHTTAFRVAYAQGPLNVGLAYTKNGRAGAKALTQLGASYNFGVATALVAYQTDSNRATAKNAYSVGARIPVGAAGVRLTWGKDDKGDTSKALTQAAVGIDYALSKRTSMYAVYASNKVKNTQADTQVTFGIGHNF